MAAVLAFGAYVVHVLRKPMDVRLKLRRAGPLSVVALAVAVPALWLQLRPAGAATQPFLGEVAGVWAVTMMACSLVLATRTRLLEPSFGGLDRMYLWHKRTAVVSTLALPVHVLLARGSGANSRLGVALGVLSLLGLVGLVLISLPRIGRILHLSYERWLLLHRFIGLWVLLAVVHGVLIDPVLAQVPLLMVVYLTISGVGLAAYAYAELVMRRTARSAVYRVESVRHPAPDIADVRLQPTTTGVRPRAGQFVFVRAEDGTGSHPFSVAGVTPDGGMRLTIRALGHGSGGLVAGLAPGRTATVSGPHGGFDYTLGRARQIWVAGGIGVAPFLGWLDGLQPDDSYRIDLFYSAADEAEAVYLDELRAAERRLGPVVRVHPVLTTREGRLTGARITHAVEVTAETHVFLCGPQAMVDALSNDLRRAGVHREFVHAERFALR